ncbi:MAG: trypsin-like peptidase domain-containing protein [Verrucomicrobiia bacterium]
MDPGTQEIRRKFLSTRNTHDLAEQLGMSYERLRYILYRSPRGDRYLSVQIRKKTGGTRTLWVPRPDFKLLQRRLLYVLTMVYQPKPSAHGFIPQKSILTNARTHTRKRHVLNIDLKDFFPSINFGRVRGMFMGRPYNLPPRVATVLAQICCHENALPQGAPTSPIVSNMICGRLDAHLQLLGRQCRCSYTRYADDITFSTNLTTFPEKLASLDSNGGCTLGQELSALINHNGFQINPTKARLQACNQRQEVTGLNVNIRPNVQRRYVRQIRAMLHAWQKYQLPAAEAEYKAKYNKKHRFPEQNAVSFPDVVKGKIQFLGMVRGWDDPIYLKLYYWFGELAPQLVKRIRPVEYPIAIRNAVWVVEALGNRDQQQGTGFFLKGVGMVTCRHVVATSEDALFEEINVHSSVDPSKVFPATVTHHNAALDLAVLNVKVAPQTFLERSSTPESAYHQKLHVAGFPNYRIGDTPDIEPGLVTSFRPVSTVRRIITNARIVRGMSGGPVFDDRWQVIGIAVTGADSLTDTGSQEPFGIIPISTLDTLLAPQPPQPT